MSVEVLVPAERRRRWSEADKAALVAATDQLGVNAVARQHRVSTSLLYNWRAARRAAAELGVPGLAGEPPVFVPVRVAPQAADARSRQPQRPRTPARVGKGQMLPEADVIEIVLPDGVALRIGGAVAVERVAAVLAMLRAQP